MPTVASREKGGEFPRLFSFVPYKNHPVIRIEKEKPHDQVVVRLVARRGIEPLSDP